MEADLDVGLGLGLQDTDTSSDPSPSFSVSYEVDKGKTVIRVSALPVEFTMNKICIQQLLGFFLAPPSSFSTPNSPSEVLEDRFLLFN